MYSLPDSLKGSRAAAKTVKFVPDATSTSPSKFDRLLQQRDPTGPTKPPTPKVDLKRLDGIASTVETAVAKLEQCIEQLEDRSHDTAAFRAEVLGALQDLRITNNERNRALDDLARDNVQLRDRVDGLATTLESMQLELSRLADRSAAASSTLTTQSVLGRTFTPTPYSYPVDDVLSGDIRMPPEQRAAFEQRYLDEGRATRPPVVVRRSTVVNVPVGASRASAPKFQLVNDENLMQPIRVPVTQRDGSPAQ
ncbi:hypothetical protein PBRA_004424 [Plasmodiophora brassicae]|nr:hypothetical protein PBRA_004424 [Plasmodiophora brassicae]